MPFAGVDPSINSTGVAVWDDGSWSFYRIAPHFTKNEITEMKGPDWTYRGIEYGKSKGEGYAENERAKTANFREIARIVASLLPCGCAAAMEGISYGSSSRTSSLYDLAGLNYLLRDALMDGRNLVIVPPCDLKKFATGKGNADKDMMSAAFAGMFPGVERLKKYDDVADAFFLASMAMLK